MEEKNKVIEKIEVFLNLRYSPNSGATGIIRVLPIGSHHLNLSTKDSDVDAVVVVASKSIKWEGGELTPVGFLESTFYVLSEMDSIGGIRLITEAINPLIKLKCEGIEFDLSCAILPVQRIDATKHVYQSSLLQKLDKQSKFSILGCVDSCRFKKLVLSCGDFDDYKNSHDVIIQWAKNRNIYSGVFCYLGGYSWRLLITHIAKSINSAPHRFIREFFDVYSKWNWDSTPLSIFPAQLKTKKREKHRKYNFQIISSTHTNTVRNMTRSTRRKIMEEFSRGDEFLERNKNASEDEVLMLLVEQEEFGRGAKMILKVCVWSKGEISFQNWKGYVSSRIVKLVFKLESLHEDIVILPNPKVKMVSSSKCNFFLAVSSTKKIKDRIDLSAKIKEFESEVKNWMGWRKGMEIKSKFQKKM